MTEPPVNLLTLPEDDESIEQIPSTFDLRILISTPTPHRRPTNGAPPRANGQRRERQKRTGRGRQRGRPADAQEKSGAQLPARTLPTTPHAQTSQRAQKQHVNQRAGQRLREKTGLIENQALPSTRPLLQLLPPAHKSARPPLVSATNKHQTQKKRKA